MTIKEKLNNILQEALINEELKSAWDDAFKYLKTEELILLVNLLENSGAQEIREISENLNKKINALTNNNADFWEKILKEEKESLS